MKKSTTLLAIALGTYCDHVLFNECLSKIVKNKSATIIVFSNSLETSKLQTKSAKASLVFEHFEIPSYFTANAELKPADPHSNLLWWSLTNPIKAYETYGWTATIRKRIDKIIVQYANVDTMLVMFSALPLLAQFPTSYLTKKHVSIAYYVPAIPNTEIPWMYDSIFKSSKWPIYSRKQKSKLSNKESHETYLSRIALSARDSEDFVNLIKHQFVHVACWNQNSIKQPKEKSYLVNNVIHIQNGIIPSKTRSQGKLPETLAFIRKENRSVIFVTFGTYSSSSDIENLYPLLCKVLFKYAVDESVHIILHSPPLSIANLEFPHDRVTIVNGYIPYHAILRYTRLVIFTGSYCLQSLCIHYKVPMIFVPVLSEQHFWAHNYLYFTRTPFITRENAADTFNTKLIHKAMTSLKVATYLTNSSNNQTNKFGKEIYKYLRSVTKPKT